MTPLVERRTITLNFGRPVTVYAEVARSGLKDSTPWVVILSASCDGKDVVRAMQPSATMAACRWHCGVAAGIWNVWPCLASVVCCRLWKCPRIAIFFGEFLTPARCWLRGEQASRSRRQLAWRASP